jgi:hypothetical protein
LADKQLSQPCDDNECGLLAISSVEAQKEATMIERVAGTAGIQDIQTIEPVFTPPVKGDTNTAETHQVVHNIGTAVGRWIGSISALQIVSAAQAQQLPAVTTQGSGVDTVADYRTGPPTRPDIHHDNGFLQNPNDPNDPTPIPTIPPTDADRQALSAWRNKLEWAERAQWLPFGPHTDIEDGLAAYRHFLDGNGADRTFSYDKFVRDDAAGKTTLQNATRDVQLGAEEIYNQMIAQDPSLKNGPVTFLMTGSQIPVGSSDKFPYPETENWQKAIGAHQIWMSATVTVRPGEKPGDPPQFSMRMTLHAEDRYNFNPGAADINTGTPDAENGRFERTGLAHQYMNYATLERDVTWMQGKPEEGTSKPVNGSGRR